jgi:hypothetical protein
MESEIKMFNPFSPQQDPGSYIDLRKRMFQHVQYLRVNDQIFDVVKNAYNQALIRENIILSRAEKDRLLSQIMKMVLDDMSKKLSQGSA